MRILRNKYGEPLISEPDKYVVPKETFDNIESTTEIKIKYFRMGLKVAITEYAIWKDGKQYVGVLQRPLKDILMEIDRGIWDWHIGE